MRTEIFNVANGDRPDVPDVAVLITDGVPTREVDGLSAEVQRIKDRSIGIVGVGVTHRVSMNDARHRIKTSPEELSKTKPIRTR